MLNVFYFFLNCRPLNIAKDIYQETDLFHSIHEEDISSTPEIDAGQKKEDHDCRLNFQGTAKAMEADAGVELIRKSQVLQEAGLNVKKTNNCS